MWATDFAAGVDARPSRPRGRSRAALRAERERVGPDGVVRVWSLDYAQFRRRARRTRARASWPAGRRSGVFFDLHTYLATPGAARARRRHRRRRRSPTRSEIVVPRRAPDRRAARVLARTSASPTRLPGASPRGPLARVVELLARAQRARPDRRARDGRQPGDFDLLRELEARGELTMRLVVPLWVKPEHDEASCDANGSAAGRARRAVARRHGEVLHRRRRRDRDRVAGGARQRTARAARRSGPTRERYAAAVATLRRRRLPVRDARDRRPRGARRARRLPRRRAARARACTGSSTSRRCGDATLDRIAAERVAASMQPLHMRWRQPDGSDEWARRLGRERAARALPHRRPAALRRGRRARLGLAGRPADPRYGSPGRACAARPGDRGAGRSSPPSAWTPSRRSRATPPAPAAVAGEAEAVRDVSRRAAAPTSRVSPRTPSTTPADDLVDVPVRLTVVGGRVVHRA